MDELEALKQAQYERGYHDGLEGTEANEDEMLEFVEEGFDPAALQELRDAYHAGYDDGIAERNAREGSESDGEATTATREKSLATRLYERTVATMIGLMIGFILGFTGCMLTFPPLIEGQPPTWRESAPAIIIWVGTTILGGVVGFFVGERVWSRAARRETREG